MNMKSGELSLLQVKRWTRCKSWNHNGGCEREDDTAATDFTPQIDTLMLILSDLQGPSP